jgi:hypothetical protein
MSKKIERKILLPDLARTVSNPETEPIRDSIEKMRLQNTVLKRMIKMIKVYSGTSDTGT